MKKTRLLIVTEAALENPQAVPLSAADTARVNGVYRTYENLLPHLKDRYHIDMLTPFDYPGEERRIVKGVIKRNTPFAAPGQATIRLVLPSADDMQARIDAMKPDIVHIATEGPLGHAAMACVRKNNVPVTTAFHTNWQQYVMEKGFHLPLVPKHVTAKGVQKLMTIFHRKAGGIMTATPELQGELEQWGLPRDRMYIVSRGIDPSIFRPYAKEIQSEKYILFVGRLAPGKGAERFCALDTGGVKKIAVGAGPLEQKLRAQFPDVEFAGFASGEKLARYYAGAEIFVLPSDTETFGMTVLESLACGTPVVALDKGGHRPILNAARGLGVMRSDLQEAFNVAVATREMLLPKERMASFIADTHSWNAEADRFGLMIDRVLMQHNSKSELAALRAA